MESKHFVTVRPESWHGRSYTRHLEQIGEKAPELENFCRYLRIVLLRAPLKFMINKPKGRIGSFLRSHEDGIDSAALWFFDHEYTRLKLPPFLIGLYATVMTVVFGLAASDPRRLLGMVLVIAGVMVFIAVFVGVGLAFGRITFSPEEPSVVFFLGTGPAPVRWIRKKCRTITETVELGATYLEAKKLGSRICPFIRFEESQ
jgi:hypothetical protein